MLELIHFSTVLWRSEDATEEESEAEKMLASVPANKKFEVICKLAEEGHTLDDIKEIEESIPFSDGSDWDDKKQLQFSQEIYKSKKNLAEVCKSMDIEMKTCLIYYYRQFKLSTDYRLMKTIIDDERYEKTANFENNLDVCLICGDGGELLICDECEGEYHLKCMRPPLKVVPEGRWECDECVDRKVLKLRNFLLARTKLAKQTEAKEGDEDTAEVLPSEETLEAVRKFGKKISELLARTDAVEVEGDVTGEVEVKPEEVGEEEEV